MKRDRRSLSLATVVALVALLALACSLAAAETPAKVDVPSTVAAPNPPASPDATGLFTLSGEAPALSPSTPAWLPASNPPCLQTVCFNICFAQHRGCEVAGNICSCI